MSDVEALLARSRVDLRRESDEWQRARRGREGAVARYDALPEALGDLVAAPSLETAASLSQARLTADSAELGPGNRLAALKRRLMRVVRFYTDRQSAFNHAALQVLEGHGAQLGRVARGVATVARAGESGRAAVADELARLGIEADRREAMLRAAVARLDAALHAQEARLDEAHARLERHAEQLQRSAERADRIERDLDEARAQAAAAARALAADRARRRGLAPPRLGALYARLEREMRGPEDEIRARVEAYVPRIAEAVGGLAPGLAFLDLGCGRGELVAALRDAGVAAEGVEANVELAAGCRRAGLPVACDDLFAALEARPEASLAGVSAIQVAEHLDPEALLDLLALAASRMVASGLLLLETIDVRTLYALRWFFADPTHRLPLVPGTLSAFVEASGFESVEILPLHPVAEPVAAPPGGSLRVDRIGAVVFGPQDFALLARRAGG